MLLLAVLLGEPDIIREEQVCKREHGLQIGEGLADTAARSEAEGTKGGTGDGDGFRACSVSSSSSSSAAALGLLANDNPPLRPKDEGLGIVVWAVLDRIRRCPDNGAHGEMVPVDCETARQHLTWQVTGYGRGEPQRLVDAGAKVDELVQGLAAADLVDGGEGAPDFGRDSLERGRVVQKVEEGRREGDGGCVGAGGDEEAGIRVELRGRESLARLGVFGVQHVVHQVLSRRFRGFFLGGHAFCHLRVGVFGVG